MLELEAFLHVGKGEGMRFESMVSPVETLIESRESAPVRGMSSPPAVAVL